MTWVILTDDQVVDELRARCRRERLAQNLSQSALAKKAGLSRPTVQRFETDEGAPSLTTLVAILRVLGGLEHLEQVLAPTPINPLSPPDLDRQRAGPRRSTPLRSWPTGDDS